MKYEDFREQMFCLEAEEQEVIQKKDSLKRKYVSELPLKLGDKVEIKGWYGSTGWLKDIKATNYGTLNIDLYLPNKNGEKSKRHRSFWSVSLEGIKILCHE